MDASPNTKCGRDRANDVLSMIRYAYDPGAANVEEIIAPATTYPIPTRIQTVSVESMIHVQNFLQIVTPGEGVNFSSGIVVQYPWFGSNCIVPYGIVNAGITSSPSISVWDASTILQVSQPAPNSGADQTQAALLAITFNDDTPIPMCNGSVAAVPQNPGVNINISPPSLDSDYTVSRLISSAINYISDTVSTGVAQLSGTFAAAAISDTRQISQVIGQGTFTPTSLTQAASPAKDGIRNVRAERGVTTLLGCDIPQDFSPFNNQPFNSSSGQISTYPVQIAPTIQCQAPAAAAPGIASQTWVSPFNTTATATLGSGFVTFEQGNPLPGYWQGTTICTQINTAFDPSLATGLNDASDIQFRYRWTPNGTLPVAGDDVSRPDVTAVATHCFATALANGQLSWTFIGELGQKTSWYGGDPVGNNCFGPCFVLNKFSPRQYLQSLQTTGIYIGSLITLCVQPGAASGGVSLLQFQDAYIDVLRHTPYIQGYAGPARVVRWDNMNPGSVIKINGSMVIQGVATANTQSILRGQTRVSRETLSACDVNATLIMNYLWNNVLQFGRVMPTERWQDMRAMTKRLSAEELVNALGQSEQGMVALMSSGFIDPLGNLLVDRSDAPGTIRMRMV